MGYMQASKSEKLRAKFKFKEWLRNIIESIDGQIKYSLGICAGIAVTQNGEKYIGSSPASTLQAV